MEFHIDFNWQIQTGTESRALEPLLLNLLSAINEHGALQQAAKDVGVSYRHAWGMMEKWQQLFGLPLIEKQRGRGTRLAPAGKYLLQAHQHLQARLLPQLINQATQLRQQIEELKTSQNQSRLTIFASHGLAISALREQLTQQEIAVDLHFHGSLESLQELHRGHCDVAGFHIPVGKLGQQIADQYLALLDAKQISLIYLVRRQQGLMITAGNPLRIRDLTDLSKNGLRFINRQRGSGTRLLFDQLLSAQQITPASIKGYQQEEFTHMAVAAMIASGAADCGFGIAAVADKFALDFLPICEEHYCLAIPTNRLLTEPVQALLNSLKAPNWRQSLAGLAGYDLSQSGQMVGFANIFGR
ncbi:MAG: substrate-binding domain-containing protein [Methylophaga sp.]|nr:substrate-binding domain-containing protein [Methylophaga sp.]